MAMPGSGCCSSPHCRTLVLAGLATALLGSRAGSAEGLVRYRDQIEQAYSARDYLELCIHELEPLVKRRHDHARARALYASCLGASANHYVLRAATRGMASGREMAAALELEPDDPWVVLQDAVSDFLTPAMFGGNKEWALDKLQRAERLFVASRPTGSSAPVFGESETWLYIGRVRLALGQKDEALKALERARDLAPASADVRDEIAKF